MSRKLALLFLLIPFGCAPTLARAHCDPAAIRAQIERAKEARDDFFTFEHLDSREGGSEICRYLGRLSIAREMAREPDCGAEALRLGAYAQRLYEDAQRMRDAFVRRQPPRAGSALSVTGDFCLN